MTVAEIQEPRRTPRSYPLARGEPAILFDGRPVMICSEIHEDDVIGRWADVREVINAADPDFDFPRFAEGEDTERVSLLGARHLLDRVPTEGASS